MRATARAIAASNVDVVCVQHEFGLYGLWHDEGWEGERWLEGTYEDHLTAFLEEVGKPTLVTMHTVLPEPTPAVREAVRQIADAADGLVVMAESAVEHPGRGLWRARPRVGHPARHAAHRTRRAGAA